MYQDESGKKILRLRGIKESILKKVIFMLDRKINEINLAQIRRQGMKQSSPLFVHPEKKMLQVQSSCCLFLQHGLIFYNLLLTCFQEKQN